MIPQAVIDRPPSAELRENQKDQDSLPPYDVLDAILLRHVDQEQSRDEIVAAGFDAATVDTRAAAGADQRVEAAPGRARAEGVAARVRARAALSDHATGYRIALSRERRRKQKRRPQGGRFCLDRAGQRPQSVVACRSADFSPANGLSLRNVDG